MKEFWNQRYAAEEYAYGTKPNAFFKVQLDALPAGKLLLPAEGEGRNAVYAAKRGWQVAAFDISEAGRQKAQQLARRHGVSIDYQVGSLEELDYTPQQFDAIGLIFAHFPPKIRPALHRQVSKLLRPGGYLILEAFSKQHLVYNTKNPQAGGPKDEALLYDTATLRLDFPGFDFIRLEEVVTVLEEGNYHLGHSAVVRMLAQKKVAEIKAPHDIS